MNHPSSTCGSVTIPCPRLLSRPQPAAAPKPRQPMVLAHVLRIASANLASDSTFARAKDTEMVARRTFSRSATSDWRRPSMSASRATTFCRAVSACRSSAMAGVMPASNSSASARPTLMTSLSCPARASSIAERAARKAGPVRWVAGPSPASTAPRTAYPADRPLAIAKCRMQDGKHRVGRRYQQTLHFVALSEPERSQPLNPVHIVQFGDQGAQPRRRFDSSPPRTDHVAEQDPPLELLHLDQASSDIDSRQRLSQAVLAIFGYLGPE